MNLREEYLQQLKDEEKEELLKNKNLIDNFKSFVDKSAFTVDSFEYIQPIGIVANSSEIVTKLNASIVRDKEGLVSCDLLDKYFTKDRFREGVMKSENYMIMAHSYFRRGYSKSLNFAPHFISLFWGLNRSKIDAYIAIDFDRVRIDIDGGYCLERDTWFGSPFNKKIEDIKDGVVKLRPPLDVDTDIIDMFFSNTYALDMMWYTTEDNIKIFQGEEFKTDVITLDIDGINYYPVRYIHAEFDIENEYFRHFDGAVQLYTKEEYDLRKDGNFNYKLKGKEQIKPKSIKLFKLNGEISIDLWIKYISHFLSGNPLVMEYFSGKYPQHIIDLLEKLKKENGS